VKIALRTGKPMKLCTSMPVKQELIEASSHETAHGILCMTA
jgi:hypothetical protein